MLLHRIVSMLTKMTKPVDGIREDHSEYGFDAAESCGVQRIDYDDEHEHE